jgi:tetratricopeptide (TPR) repeat protein
MKIQHDARLAAASLRLLVLIAVFMAVSLLCASCAPVSSRVSFLGGRLALTSAQSWRAFPAFTRAADHQPIRGWAEYALGSACLLKGELEAAQSYLRPLTTQGLPRELAWRVWYNLGNALYQQADWLGALDAYRSALRLYPASIAAKRNLELTLRQLDRESLPASSSAPLQRGQDESEGSSFFNYIREKEADRWKGREWQTESVHTPDY